MIEPLTIILFVVTIVAGITALTVKDLLAAVFVLAAYSFSIALIYAEMGALDVSFTEASVGAGVSGVYMLAALYFLNRRSKD
jgi:energy-converting hydrogenase B subunit D